MFLVIDYISIFIGALTQWAIGFGWAIITNAVMSINHPIQTIWSSIVLFQLLTGSIIISRRLYNKDIKIADLSNKNTLINISIFRLTSFFWIILWKRLLLHIDNQTWRYLIAWLVIISLSSRYLKSESSLSKKLEYVISWVLWIFAWAFGFAFNTNWVFVALLVLFCRISKTLWNFFSVLYFFIMNIIFIFLHNKIWLLSDPFSQTQLYWYMYIILWTFTGILFHRYIPEKYYHNIIICFLVISLILLLI